MPTVIVGLACRWPTEPTAADDDEETAAIVGPQPSRSTSHVDGRTHFLVA